MKDFFNSVSSIFKDLFSMFQNGNKYDYLFIFLMFPCITYFDIVFIKSFNLNFLQFLFSTWFLYVFSLININLITIKKEEKIDIFKINFVSSSFVLLFLISYMIGIFVFSYYLKFNLSLSLLLLISSLFFGTANANLAFYRSKKRMKFKFFLYNLITVGLYFLEYYTLGENIFAYTSINLLSILFYIGSVKYVNKKIKKQVN